MLCGFELYSRWVDMSIWHLSEEYPFSTKWPSSVEHSGFQDQRVHCKVENTPIRLTNGKRKFKRMLFFLFLDKLKLFFAKLSFQEFNLVFFKAEEHLAYFSMPSGQWSIWRNFRYILYSMVKENTFIEGFFCIY